ncbi:MAG: molybdopterin-dependent oxidoreductase [Clostridia bacterium]
MQQTKKSYLILLILVLILSAVVMFGCDKTTDEQPVTNDDGYTIVIKGISAEDISVTKAQIKAIFAEKPVIFGDDNPVYASDKTDDDGNLIKHTVKGVYLDDVLAIYADGAISGSFSMMTLSASDGYQSILTAETFSEEHGGSKMIIVLEYDGYLQSPEAKGGALRAVFPDQIANSWAKYLTEIEFSNTVMDIPTVEKVSFLSALGDSYNGSFDSDEEIGGATKVVSHYGVSVKKLLESNILLGSETDKMFINAWDYISNGTESTYRPYENWKTYEYYNDAYLVMASQIAGEEKEDEIRAPIFDATNILEGMCVKNVLSLSVGETALVCENVAFTRYDTDSNNSIDFKDVLTLVKLYKSDSNFTLTCVDNSELPLTSAQIDTATFTKVAGDYKLNIGSDSYLIKSISINK